MVATIPFLLGSCVGKVTLEVSSKVLHSLLILRAVVAFN